MDMSVPDGSAASQQLVPSDRTTPARIRNSKATDWPAEHTTAFRHMIEVQGLSAGEAAQALNERFGTEYTRNACCGRRHRLCLSGPERPRVSLEEIRAKRAERRARREASFVRRSVTPPPHLVRCAAVEPLGITFDMMASDQNTCKWPGDEYPYTYCGHSKYNGSSYCAAHHIIGHVSSPKAGIDQPWATRNFRKHNMDSRAILGSTMLNQDDPDA